MTEPTAQEIEALVRELRVTIMGRDYMADHALTGRAARALSSLSQRLAEAEREQEFWHNAFRTRERVLDNYVEVTAMWQDRATAAEARLAKCRGIVRAVFESASGSGHYDPALAKALAPVLAALDASEPPHDGGETGSKG